MARADRPLRRLYPYHLHPNFTQRKYYFENFQGGQVPLVGIPVATGGFAHTVLATGGADERELDAAAAFFAITPGGGYWEGAATTAQSVSPMQGSAGNGLNIAGDKVDNESLDFVIGGNADLARLSFKAGTDTDFFFRCKLKIADVSGTDQTVVGFRKREAFVAAASVVSWLNAGDAGYTDFSGFLFQGGDLKVTTDLNNSGSATATDTAFNVADNDIVEVELRVVGRKAVYLINGYGVGSSVAKDGDGTSITAQSTISMPSFTFDSGDYLVPFIFVRHDATTPGNIFVREVEVGHLVDVGKDPNVEA